MLAWRLHKAGALADFDPYPMVRGAARYLIDSRTRHTAGALGRKQRLLALDPGEQYRRH